MKTQKILKQAISEGIITCSECGNKLEPDADRCFCGWENPLRKEGLI